LAINPARRSPPLCHSDPRSGEEPAYVQFVGSDGFCVAAEYGESKGHVGNHAQTTRADKLNVSRFLSAARIGMTKESASPGRLFGCGKT